MITTKLKQYCRDNFEKIENYDLAINDKENVKNLNNSNIDKSGSNNSRYQKCNSTFGKKYLEHFGYSKCDNIEQYYKERNYYNFHKKCSWE